MSSWCAACASFPSPLPSGFAFSWGFQVKVELVQGLGKHIDNDVLGTMLINEANLSSIGKKSIMASTMGSISYPVLLGAMRQDYAAEGGEASSVLVGGCVGGGLTLVKCLLGLTTTDQEMPPF